MGAGNKIRVCESGLSNEKKPAPSSLSPAEWALVHLYRALPSERQELIVEQENFINILNQNRKKSEKRIKLRLCIAIFLSIMYNRCWRLTENLRPAKRRAAHKGVEL